MSYAALQQYQRSSGSYLNPREIEVMALNFVNRQLRDAVSGPVRRAALATNIKLWSILMNGVQDQHSPLPPVTKHDLIAVGSWAMRYSNEALNSFKPLQPLIDINQDMVDGLSTPRAPQTVSPAAPVRTAQAPGMRALAMMG